MNPRMNLTEKRRMREEVPGTEEEQPIGRRRSTDDYRGSGLGFLME